MPIYNKNLKNIQEVTPSQIIKSNNNGYKLLSSISIPSAMVVFSTATGYMKSWFLSKFNDDFFKAINVDESHSMPNYRKANLTNNIKKMKPSLQIIPKLNFDYNLDNVDLNDGNLNMYINRESAVNRSFFRDPEKNMYLTTILDQNEINFQFRVRLRTRAQQMDIARRMQRAFRIGTTQGRDVDMDFHIPYDTVLNIAKDSGFDIVDNKIQNLPGFLKYMNRNSSYPILYKYRTDSGQRDFFMRVNNLYTHIDCRDQLSLDDGEQEGQLKSNYIIEMNANLHIISPKMYVYFSANKYSNSIETEEEETSITLYDIKIPHIEEVNQKGWHKYVMTDVYEDDLSKPLKIEFEELFAGTTIGRLIKYNNDLLITSSTFIDIHLFNNGEPVYFTINWTKQTIETRDIMKNYNTNLIVYVDLDYVNEKIIDMDKLYNNTLSTSGNK